MHFCSVKKRQVRIKHLRYDRIAGLVFTTLQIFKNQFRRKNKCEKKSCLNTIIVCSATNVFNIFFRDSSL